MYGIKQYARALAISIVTCSLSHAMQRRASDSAIVQLAPETELNELAAAWTLKRAYLPQYPHAVRQCTDIAGGCLAICGAGPIGFGLSLLTDNYQHNHSWQTPEPLANLVGTGLVAAGGLLMIAGAEIARMGRNREQHVLILDTWYITQARTLIANNRLNENQLTQAAQQLLARVKTSVT